MLMRNLLIPRRCLAAHGRGPGSRAVLGMRWVLLWLLALWVMLCAGQPRVALAQDLLRLGGMRAVVAGSDEVRTPQVRAQLLAWAPQGVDAAAQQPGLQLGLRLEHQPGWHTYWQNPGDAGQATQLNWTLPEGLTPGDVQWPVPRPMRTGALVSYGYDGAVLLTVPVTVDARFAPALSGQAEVRLHAQWLACKVECIPQEGHFVLQVPVAGASTLFAADFEAAREQLPAEDAAVQAQLVVQPSGEEVVLQVQGLPAAVRGQELLLYPQAPDTFAHGVPPLSPAQPLLAGGVAGALAQESVGGRTSVLAAAIDSAAPAGAVSPGAWWDGDVWRARLPLSDLRGDTPARLGFVLAAPDGRHAAASATASGMGAIASLAASPSASPAARAARAWRVQAQVQGQWSAAALPALPPALEAALQDVSETRSQPGTQTVPVPRPQVGAENVSAGSVSAPALAPAPTSSLALSAPAMATTVTTAGWFAALLGGLVGGLLLNLMPCVFPVLAIKLLGFAQHGGNVRVQRASALAYAAGVVLSFVALGAVLLALRAAGEQLGWGFQLQNPLVVAALAALFTLIALNLAGVFELAQIVPNGLANLHARHPVADALLSGMVAVAVASPCTAPFMGASLGFAVGMPPVQALGVFASLGVGMALPYVLAGWVPALTRWLPRPGPWMQTLRRAMAFPMLATVVWLAWVLGQQTGVDGVVALLALLLVLSALVWALTLRGRCRAVLVALLLVLGGWLAVSALPHLLAPASGQVAQGLPSTEGNGDVATAAATRAPAGASVTFAQAPSADRAVRWQPWTAQAQHRLLAQGQPVFVDYTAAWCITCQYNKRTTLANAEVLAAFAAHNVALLRADWTRRDPAITQALAQLGRSGVPVYVLLAPGRQPQVLSELPSVQEVVRAVQSL